MFAALVAVKVIPPEAVIKKCSVKKVFLEISQNSQENTWHSLVSKTSGMIKLFIIGLMFSSGDPSTTGSIPNRFLK